MPVTCVAMRWECSAHTVSSLQWLVRSGTGLSVPCTLGGSLTPWLEQSGEVWLSDSLICHHGYQGAGRDGKFNIHYDVYLEQCDSYPRSLTQAQPTGGQGPHGTFDSASSCVPAHCADPFRFLCPSLPHLPLSPSPSLPPNVRPYTLCHMLTSPTLSLHPSHLPPSPSPPRFTPYLFRTFSRTVCMVSSPSLPPPIM